MGTGLLIDGKVVAVPGLDITNERDNPKARTAPGDCQPRKTPWIRQIICHTTKGMAPQHVKPGAGPLGKGLDVAEFFYRDDRHAGAHLVIGRAGEVWCLADLRRVNVYHATVSNDWSIGIEGYQEADGGIYEAVLDSYVKLVVALCELFGIQFQIPGKPWRGRPLERLRENGLNPGGPDVVGVIGHRDNTARRGRGDPGDELFDRLQRAGAEPLITDGGNELSAWRLRQHALGFTPAECDGVAGPKTTAAMRAAGFPGGVWALGTHEQRTAFYNGPRGRR